MTHFQNIGIIGAGAWGTALAQAVAHAGCDVMLWSYEADVAESINQTHENTTYLADILLDDKISATTDMMEALNQDAVLIVTPAQHTGKVLEPYVDKISLETPLLICSKGIEISTGRLLSQVLGGLFPNNPLGVMCGPSFAIETAKGLPTAITLAMPSRHEQIGYDLCRALSSPTFRLYLSDDIIGAQVGAALKNVIAIACGISAGRKMGDNTRAAIITRGLAEIKRLGIALGAEGITFSGLSGVGDLVLTCNAMQSRNFSLGVRVGEGESLQKIMGRRNTVSEGVHTAEAVVRLADKLGVDMPISRAVHETLSGRQAIEQAIKGLLERPLTMDK
jgi:glycerol-3-phosphate dehydrogenase (NAD(P)+)